MNAVKLAEYKDCLHRVMNREYMTVLFSGLHDKGSHKKLKATDINHFPRQTRAQRLPEAAQGWVMSSDTFELIILC